ncbi:hypothetical protein H2203_005214 [Taxawa tesnikishii (nom. ined.)]|nr:hypothetical protein H2203_005214 [Dothideales sp. JES 119]
MAADLIDDDAPGNPQHSTVASNLNQMLQVRKPCKPGSTCGSNTNDITPTGDSSERRSCVLAIPVPSQHLPSSRQSQRLQRSPAHSCSQAQHLLMPATASLTAPSGQPSMSEPKLLQTSSMQSLSSIPTRITAHLPVAMPSQLQYDLYAQMQHAYAAYPGQLDDMPAHWHNLTSIQHYRAQYGPHAISSTHPSLAAQPPHHCQQSCGCDNLELGPSSYQTAASYAFSKNTHAGYEPEAALGYGSDENNDTVGNNIVFDVMGRDVA